MCDDFNKQLQETKERKMQRSLHVPTTQLKKQDTSRALLSYTICFYSHTPAPPARYFPQFTKHIFPRWQLAVREVVRGGLGVGEGKRDGGFWVPSRQREVNAPEMPLP